MACYLRGGFEGGSRDARRPAHGLLLGPPRAGAGGELGLQARRGAHKLPYQDNLSALIHEPSFKQTAGEAVFNKARVINTLGNRAVHSHRAVPEADAQQRRFVCCCAPLTAGLHRARAVLHSTRRSNGNTSRESRATKGIVT
jgi:hypothetical protein